MNPAPIEITPIDIDEIRAGFAWIAERVRRGHEGTQPIAGTTAAKASAYIEQLEARAAACTCEHHKTFDLTAHQMAPSRDNPLAAAFAVNSRKAARFEAPEQQGA